jgi:hypothetical protein
LRRYEHLAQTLTAAGFYVHTREPATRCSTKPTVMRSRRTFSPGSTGLPRYDPEPRGIDWSLAGGGVAR